MFSHGFVNAADGRKMSKSFNNAVDPNTVLDLHGVDSIRYYMVASISYGSDISFSEDSLEAMHNSELADVLGNLVHRALSLCHKYCGGSIPDTQHDEHLPQRLPFDLSAIRVAVQEDLKSCAIHAALFRGMEAARATNRFLTEAEPWKMKGTDEARRPAIVRTTLEAIFAFTHLLAPVIPLAAQQIFTRLGSPPTSFLLLDADLYNLQPGTAVSVGEVLFQKSEPKAKEAIKGPAVVANGDDVAHPHDLSKADIRVGVVTKVWPHPTSARLFCEEIDVGEALPRQVASGLRGHYSEEQLLGRRVLLLCNLKEARFQGFLSQGLVLAAAAGERLELVEPPGDSPVGERLLCGGEDALPPFSAAKMKKARVWEAVAPGLHTDSSCGLCWTGPDAVQRSLVSFSGPCRVASLADAKVT